MKREVGCGRLRFGLVLAAPRCGWDAFGGAVTFLGPRPQALSRRRFAANAARSEPRQRPGTRGQETRGRGGGGVGRPAPNKPRGGGGVGLGRPAPNNRIPGAEAPGCIPMPLRGYERCARLLLL